MQIRDFYRDVLGFRNEEVIEELSAASRLYKYKKDQILVRQGEIQKSICFLLEGVMRGYYIDANGKEITDQFGFQLGDAAMACFEPGEPTTVSIEAVTDGQSIELSMEELVRLCHKYMEVVDVYNRLLQEGMRKHQHIKTMIQFNEVADRYKWFLEEYPGLIDIVKHKDIASFIGTNPVNLSRVRKKLKTPQG